MRRAGAAGLPSIGTAAARPTSSDRGFSLVEVLAALAVAAVVLLGVAGLSSTSLSLGRRATETTDATVAASERLEALMALPPTSTKLAPGRVIEYLPERLVRETYIVRDLPAPGAKTIRVRVVRTGSGRSVTLLGIRTQ